MGVFWLEPLIGTEDMQNQSDREDLEDAVDEHGPGDQLPLLSPCSGSCCALTPVEEDEQERDE